MAVSLIRALLMASLISKGWDLSDVAGKGQITYSKTAIFALSDQLKGPLCREGSIAEDSMMVFSVHQLRSFRRRKHSSYSQADQEIGNTRVQIRILELHSLLVASQANSHVGKEKKHAQACTDIQYY